jgi:hypothetical protein
MILIGLCYYILCFQYEQSVWFSTFHWAIRTRSPKTPYTLKRPKTRVVPKTDLYPEKRLSLKTPYVRKSPNPKTGLKQVSLKKT